MSPLIFPRQIIRIFPSLLFFFSSVDRLFFFSKYFPPLPSHLEKRYFPSLKYFLPSPYLFFFCPANQLFSWVQIFPSFPSPFSLFSTKKQNHFSICCISISINRKFALLTWSSFRKDPFFIAICVHFQPFLVNTLVNIVMGEGEATFLGKNISAKQGVPSSHKLRD